jgi:hypothetical protein
MLKGAVGAVLLSTSLIGGAFLGLGVAIPFLFLFPPVYYAIVGLVQTAWGYFLCGVAGESRTVSVSGGEGGARSGSWRETHSRAWSF